MKLKDKWLQLFISVFSILTLAHSSLCFTLPSPDESVAVQEIEVINFVRKSPEENSIQDILDLLQEGDENIVFGTQKEATVVLGNTGAGKSTLALLIAGDNTKLVSKEVGEGSGEYIIVDENEKISENSTITSQTLYPDLVIDEITDTAFYDCPGFSDTRSPSFDIAATYFTKKVMDHLEKVKLVFAVNYASVRQGGDRFDFMLLMKHMSDMVIDINKYNESTALVVTKVENTYKKEGNDMVLVPDEKVTESIAQFIELAKQDIVERMGNPNVSPEDKLFYEKAIAFINIVLMKQGENYPRIGLFRRPDEPGKISEIELMQKCRKALRKIVLENIDYTPKKDEDFGYTISAESINHVGDLIKEITKLIITNTANIGKEIEEYHLREENDMSDINILQQRYKTSYEVLSATSSAAYIDPAEFINQLLQDLEDLNIYVSRGNVVNILNYDQHLKFLEAVSGEKVPDYTVWLKGLSDVVKFLGDSQKWFGFVINLYTLLSGYPVQQDITRYDITMLKFQLNIKEDQTVKVSDTELKKLIDEVNKAGYDTGYDEIKHLQLDKTRADLLSTSLDLTLRHKTTASCISEHEVVIKGQYVKLSEADKLSSTCNNNTKSIQIFALNRIFVDGEYDKTGKMLDLSIVSPRWEILGTTNIKLNGEEAEAHKDGSAGNGIGNSMPGQLGKPGLPGGTSGNFWGVGGEFINMNRLNIHANGGKGAKGQDGGRGSPGKSYPDPPVPEKDKDESWDDTLYGVEVIGQWQNANPTTQYYETTFRVTGTKGGDGGAGGDGGIRGTGGHAGNINIINLNGPVDASFSTKKGEDGGEGKGGEGAKGGKSGNILVVVKEEKYILGIHLYTAWRVKSRKDQSNGTNGNRGKNNSNKKDQKLPLPLGGIIPSYVVNDYKVYLRENLAGSIIGSSLSQFIEKLENNTQVANSSDTLGLINEFQDLENQFYDLQRKIPLLPYYYSLLNKIILYSENPKSYEKSNQHKKVLSHLYTSALSKISGMKNDLEGDLVVDVKQYLELVIRSINRLKELTTVAAVNEYNKDYKEIINEKCMEAMNFLETEVIPVINQEFENLDHTIERLVNETIDLEEAAHVEKEKLLQKQNEMRRALNAKTFLGVLKVTTQLFSLAGPLGSAVGTTLGGGLTIVDSLFLSDENVGEAEKLLAIPSAATQSLNAMKGVIKEQQNALKKQLDDIDEELKSFLNNESDNNIKKIKKEVEEARKKLAEEIAKGASLDPGSVDILYSTRKELTSLLEQEKKELQKEKENTGKDVEKQLKLVDHAQNIIKVGEMSIKLYNDLEKEKKKLDKVGDNIKAVDDQIKQLRQFEENIYKIMIPTLKNLENVMTDMEKDLKGKSHVALDIKKWQMQTMMTDVKRQMEKMTKGFSVEEDLVRCLEKIEEAMLVMINIYDRLEDYQEKQSFADYIANINSPRALGIKIDNATLQEAVDKLEVIITSNLVIGQYEKAMAAFKQYIYPFAHYYLEEYSLPPSLKQNDTVDHLVHTAVSQIEDISNKITESTILIGKYDKHVYKDIEFSSRRTRPFVIWPYDTNKDTIKKLMQGEEIIIRADITNGVDRNAIKFNEVGIRLKAENETIQNNLDESLKDYQLTIIHLGISYYRCDNRFYTIPSHNQTIIYSIERDSKGEPIIKNLVYTKIKNNDELLSPYTLWNIRLKNLKGNANLWQQYKNEKMDLELEGRGLYMDKGIDVCNDNLQLYYDNDNTISDIMDIDAADRTTFRRLLLK